MDEKEFNVGGEQIRLGYEVNHKYVSKFESAGMRFVGRSVNNVTMKIKVGYYRKKGKLVKNKDAADNNLADKDIIRRGRNIIAKLGSQAE